VVYNLHTTQFRRPCSAISYREWRHWRIRLHTLIPLFHLLRSPLHLSTEGPLSSSLRHVDAPSPSQTVSLSTSHPVQGTLASKMNVGCKCLMACRCFLRCRFCRCPCIFLFRLQDTLNCRSGCSICTAKFRLSRNTRVLSRNNTRVPVYFAGVLRFLSRLSCQGLCPAANSISWLVLLF
jgi:hypothetical protein